MSILFSEIYQRSIALFDDPKISTAYSTSKIQFEKLMYTFLQTAITSFHNPAEISFRLAQYSAPEGLMDVITSDGVNTQYDLDASFVIKSNSIYAFTAAGESVEATLDTVNRKVTFPYVIPSGYEYTVEQYYEGEFTSDFTGITSKSSVGDDFVVEAIKDILARLIVISWAEGERNNLLDIRNMMSQTDFKNSPNDKILKSKNQWIDQLNAEISQKQNRLAWAITFMGNSGNLGRL